MTPEEIAENPTAYKGEWTANKVAEVTEEKYDGDTSISDVSMVLINARQQKRVRQMRMFRKDMGDNLRDERTSTFFLSPADIRNTAYLSYEYDEEAKEEESWLYLPALKKVKRLSASDKADPFMGSDFAYNDLKANHREYWNYSFVSESEMLDGKECWVIEGTPRPDRLQKVEDETGYLKTRLWIRKDCFVKVKGMFWVRKGRRLKYFKASDIKKIDGVWTPMVLQMVTTKNNRVEHSTVMKFTKVSYNKPIEDNFLTPHGIESGRM
ncbi:hypothetical protein BVY04_03075 [bacterium M21]|nr:hypothetical protein BVY04_03075 [bacterium M21]